MRVMKHISEFDGAKSLELEYDANLNIVLNIETYLAQEPSVSIKFTQDGIKEIIEDLQNLIKEEEK